MPEFVWMYFGCSYRTFPQPTAGTTRGPPPPWAPPYSSSWGSTSDKVRWTWTSHLSCPRSYRRTRWCWGASVSAWRWSPSRWGPSTACRQLCWRFWLRLSSSRRCRIPWKPSRTRLPPKADSNPCWNGCWSTSGQGCGWVPPSCTCYINTYVYLHQDN